MEVEGRACLGAAGEPVCPVVGEEVAADVEEQKEEVVVVYHVTSVAVDWNTDHHHHQMTPLRPGEELVEAWPALTGVVVRDSAAEGAG